jgi:L-asparagine transporter-like permease
MIFIVLGNLSGNAIAFGQNILVAADLDNENTGQVIGLAIAALTVACLLHVFTRRGGILVNNCFAVFKVAILLAIIIIGFAVAGGANFGGGSSQTANFNVHTSFSNPSRDVANYTDSFYFILYAFSGFQQPFYVSLY